MRSCHRPSESSTCSEPGQKRQPGATDPSGSSCPIPQFQRPASGRSLRCGPSSQAATVPRDSTHPTTLAEFPPRCRHLPPRPRRVGIVAVGRAREEQLGIFGFRANVAATPCPVIRRSEGRALFGTIQIKGLRPRAAAPFHFPPGSAAQKSAGPSIGVGDRQTNGPQVPLHPGPEAAVTTPASGHPRLRAVALACLSRPDAFAGSRSQMHSATAVSSSSASTIAR